jgi:hypothetical protein
MAMIVLHIFLPLAPDHGKTGSGHSREDVLTLVRHAHEAGNVLVLDSDYEKTNTIGIADRVDFHGRFVKYITSLGDHLWLSVNLVGL